MTGLVPAWRAGDVRVFVNVYNVLDEIYVQDAVDNSSFNSFDSDHDADDAEGFLGIPRNLNIGVELTFWIRGGAELGAAGWRARPGLVQPRGSGLRVTLTIGRCHVAGGGSADPVFRSP